eukprot:scaffold77365_cov21-Tisochrysis_lutea.AAC.1
MAVGEGASGTLEACEEGGSVWHTDTLSQLWHVKMQPVSDFRVLFKTLCKVAANHSQEESAAMLEAPLAPAHFPSPNKGTACNRLLMTGDPASFHRLLKAQLHPQACQFALQAHADGAVSLLQGLPRSL